MNHPSAFGKRKAATPDRHLKRKPFPMLLFVEIAMVGATIGFIIKAVGH